MPDHTEVGLKIRNVAIATDFGPWSNRAMQHALEVAHRFRAVLHILHTVRRSEFALAPDMISQLDKLAERDCKDLIELLHAAHSLDGIEHRSWNLEGECSEVFGEFVRDQNIDLLVIGTRGRSGIAKLLLGSIAEEISRCVPCPVLTVGPWSREPTRPLEVRRVLFASDLSTRSCAAIPYVLTAAKMSGAKIDVLQLSLSPNSKYELFFEDFSHEMEREGGDKQDLGVQYHLQSGAPPAAVLNLARQSKTDLIVFDVDNHSHRFSSAHPSHVYEVVRKSMCPVLCIRS